MRYRLWHRRSTSSCHRWNQMRRLPRRYSPRFLSTDHSPLLWSPHRSLRTSPRSIQSEKVFCEQMRRTPLLKRAVKSTTETLAVGTRKAMPVNLPFRSGMTFPTYRTARVSRRREEGFERTAFAAPVDEGIMFCAAPRPPRQSWISRSIHEREQQNNLSILYLARWTIDRLLCRCVRMHGGHQCFDNAELLVNDFGQRCQTIGRARGIGDDGLTAGVFLFVHAHDEHRGISRRSRDHHFLRSGLNMRLTLVHCGEDAGGFHHVFRTCSRDMKERVFSTVDEILPRVPQGIFDGSFLKYEQCLTEN